MPRQDGRIEQGQSLKSAISARAWNRAQDAADIVLGQRYGTQANAAQDTRAPFTALPCRNNSGQDVPLWGVLRISGLEVSPSGPTGPSVSSFQMMPVLQGNTPTASTNDAFVVAVEPIRNGAIGQVAVDGVVQVKLDVLNAADATAGPKVNSRTELQTGGGNATILWKETGTGPGKWGLVRFGGRSGLVRGTFEGSWPINNAATVTDESDGSVTYSVMNYWASVNPSSVASCQIANVANEWVLVSLDLTQLTDYNNSAEQVLAHSNTGVLKWISTVNCA